LNLSACNDDSRSATSGSNSAAHGREVPLITGAPASSVTAGEN